MRTSTAKVRVFDAATRAEIQRKKLAALEADNWVEDRPKDDDDDDYQDADSGDGVTANPTWIAPLTQMPNGSAVPVAEMAVDAPKRKNRKKKVKNDKFSAAQKCKTLQACTHKKPCPCP